MQIAPGDCFAACGFYHPEPMTLNAIRSRIAAHPDMFNAVTETLAAAGLKLSKDDALKRNPRGYGHVADPKIASALRPKSFVTIMPFSERDAEHASLVAKLVDDTQSAKAILDLVDQLIRCPVSIGVHAEPAIGA